jgi:hypothetical protein
MGGVEIAVQFPAGVKGEAVPVDAMKTYRGSKIVATQILNLGARWRRFVSVTAQPLHPGKSSGTTGPVWAFLRRDKHLAPTGI